MIKRIRDPVHGAPYSSFKTDKTENLGPAQLGDLSAEDAKQYLARFSGYTSTVLELAATVHWLAFKEERADWRDEIEVRKAGKTSNGRLDKALTLLQDLNLAPTSQ